MATNIYEKYGYTPKFQSPQQSQTETEHHNRPANGNANIYEKYGYTPKPSVSEPVTRQPATPALPQTDMLGEVLGLNRPQKSLESKLYARSDEGKAETSMRQKILNLQAERAEAEKAYKTAQLGAASLQGTDSAANQNVRDARTKLDAIEEQLVAIDPNLGTPTLKERVENTLSGSLKGAAGTTGTGIAFMGDWGRYGTEDNEDYALAEGAFNVVDDDYRKRMEQEAQASQAIREKSRQLSEDSASELARAKQGLGAGGRLAVDVASTGVQIASDALMNLLTGGIAGTAAMGLRSFGGAVEQAQADGATMNETMAYAAATGAKDLILNRLLGGLGRVYGDSKTGKAIASMIDNYAGSPSQKKLLSTALNALSEGGEEIAEAVVGNALKSIYNDKGMLENVTDEELGDYLYEGLIGAILGGATESIGGLADSRRSRVNTNTEVNAEQTAPTETAPIKAPTPEAKAEPTAEEIVAEILSGTVSNSQARQIMNSPELKDAFYALTGERVVGTNSEQRNIIKEASQTARIETEVEGDNEIAPNTAESGMEQADELNSVPAEYGTRTVEAFADETEDLLDMLLQNGPARVSEAPAASPNVQPAAPSQLVPNQNPNPHPPSPYVGSGKEVEAGYGKNLREDKNREQDIQNYFEQNKLMYKQLSNKDTLGKAKAIYAKGLLDAKTQLTDALANARAGTGKLAPEMVPLSKMVADELARNGQLDEASRILEDVAAELTEAGQLGQAAKILKYSSPASALEVFKKAIDNINRSIEAKYPKRYTWRAALTATEEAQILQTDFDQPGAFEALYDQIGTRLGEEMPATLGEKLNELRRVNMLLRPRTMIKNTVGNVPMAVLRKGAEKLSGALQDLAVKSGKLDAKDQTRTAKVSDQSRRVANDIYAQVKDELSGNSNKWDMAGVLRRERTIFKGTKFDEFINSLTGKDRDSYLETARRLTYDLLEKGDAPFVKSAFVDSLSQYCEAHGIRDVDNVTQKAIDFATAKAMEATFKNTNALAEALITIKNNGGALATAVDILLPFTTTPINITSQLIQYSPLEIFHTLKLAIDKESTVDIIESASKAAVGSAVMAVGALLRSMGIVTAGEDDDKDKAAFDKSVGRGSYSLQGSVVADLLPEGKMADWVERRSLSYDWAQPAGSLIALGAEIYDAIEGSESFLDAATNAAYTAGDAILNMSMFQNVLQILKGTGYPTQQVLDAVIEGGASQLVPGLLGDIAKIIDKSVRTSYTGGNTFETAGAKMLGTLPFGSLALPESVNVQGEVNTRGSFPERLVNALANPANVTIGNRTEATDAISALYEETGNKTIFPQVSPYKVEENGTEYKLSGQDRAKFQETQGQAFFDAIEALIGDGTWERMPNDLKVKTAQRLNSWALDLAKREFVESKGDEYSSDWDNESKLDDVTNLLVAQSAASMGMPSDKEKEWNFDAIDFLLGDIYPKLSKEAQESLADSYGRIDDLAAAHDVFMGSEQWKGFYDKWKEISDTSGLSANEKAVKFAAYVDSQGLPYTQREAIKGNLTFSSGFVADTATYDELRGANFSADEADRLFSAISNLTARTDLGYSTVSVAQKMQTIANMSDLTPEKMLEAFVIYGGSSANNIKKIIAKSDNPKDAVAAVLKAYPVQAKKK